MPEVSTAASKVRQEFADFLDDARQRPQYIKRRSYHYIVVPAETFEELVPLSIKVKDTIDNDGSHFTENKQFPDVIGFGVSAEDALSSFKEGLVSYSYEYYDRFPYYSAAPGRQEQAPMILHLISHYERFGNLDEIVKAA
ncbi:MAG: hypothetical protein LBJ48_07365 [Coriobacteriales bacterium]|jgi:hypothetical protein|nr:hypothetical protein [Coriobacteriales bacterium]